MSTPRDRDVREFVAAAGHIPDIPTMQRLLDIYPTIIDLPATSGYTALLTASLFGRLEVVQFLLDRGADVNKGNAVGRTSLHGASLRGRLHFVRLLLDRGADIHKANNDGYVPLHDASQLDNNFEVIELMIERGATVTQQICDSAHPTLKPLLEGKLA